MKSLNNQTMFRCASVQQDLGKKLEKALGKGYTDTDCLEELWALFLEVFIDSLERDLLSDSYSCSSQQDWIRESQLSGHTFLIYCYPKPLTHLHGFWMKVRLPKT